jgi:hypothetical protein
LIYPSREAPNSGFIGSQNTLGEKEGWLVISDRSPEKAWDEKIYWQEKVLENRIIRVVGC